MIIAYQIIVAASAASPEIAHATAPTVPWWGPLLIQTLGSLGGVWAGATLVGRREHHSRELKRQADIAYLVVTVSGLLEQFVSDCADLAADDGTSQGQVGPNGRQAQVRPPTLDLSKLDVEWMALPSNLLDQLHSIPIRLDTIRRYLSFHASVLDEDDYFDERQLKYTELGLKAAEASKTLRTFGGLPPLIDADNNTATWLNENRAKLLSRRARVEEEQARMHALLSATPSSHSPTPQ